MKLRKEYKLNAVLVRLAVSLKEITIVEHCHNIVSYELNRVQFSIVNSKCLVTPAELINNESRLAASFSSKEIFIHTRSERIRSRRLIPSENKP